MSSRAGNDEIYVMNAVDNNNDGNGDNLKRLTRNPENDLAPAWSPNGKKIAFLSRRGISGDFEIYSMAANGTEQNPLTENTANDLNPA